MQLVLLFIMSFN